MTQQFSHTDEKGKAAMVDVGNKPIQHRRAIAKGMISLEPNTIRLIRDNEIKKGDVLTLAEIAGIQAAKQTPALIPLCHPLLLSKIKVECSLVEKGIEVIAEIRCTGQTGVEMEALTAVSVSLLTIYDMCKAVDKKMEMHSIQLLEKTKQD
jgi:cyclic pyranopterin phosphate synthase